MEKLEMYDLQIRMGKDEDWRWAGYSSGSKSDLRDRMTAQNVRYRIVERKDIHRENPPSKD